MRLYVFQLTFISTFFILLNLFTRSVFSFPLHIREEELKLQVLVTQKSEIACSDYKAEFLQLALKRARKWTSDAAELFKDTDDEILKQTKLANAWLSPDGSSPSKESFVTNHKKIPADFHGKNNLKSDASIHLGNVAESFALPLGKSEISQAEALGSRKDGSFIFVCFPEKPSKELDIKTCKTSHVYAATHPTWHYMVLCPSFFTGMGEVDPKKDSAQVALEKLINGDRRDYQFALEDGEVFSHPVAPVTALIHEAQHSRALLKTTYQWDGLDDIPDDTTLDPFELLDPTLLKPQDRSRNPENWALVAFITNADRQKTFMEKGTKWV